MHAVRAERQSDVGAVVDDETHAARARDSQSLFRLAVELTRREMLLAQLYERRAAVRQARDLLRVRQARQTPVCYRVELR